MSENQKQPGEGNKKDYDGSTPLKSIMQEMFVDNLLRNMCATEAFRQAGYKSKTPSNGANQLQRSTNVAARIAYRRGELQKEMRLKTGITETKVLEEIRRLAFSNMQDFLEMDGDGNIIFRDFQQIPRELMAAVESVKITRTTTHNKKGDREYTTQHTQFKLHPKTANLEQLCKHLGLFAKDNEQSRPQIAMVMQKFVINNGNDDRNTTGDNPGDVSLRSLLAGSPSDAVEG